MMPLILKIKKESHKRIAEAQDTIINELYGTFNNAVLHGGTAIWRCYKGNRFSEDIDAYITKDTEKIDLFFNALEKKGFIVEKRKVGDNSIYSNLLFNRTYVRFEAVFKKAEGTLKEYETVDGNLITVYTLTPEEFIVEKVNTYLKREKIRDLYDIFFLIRYVKNKNLVKADIQRLIEGFKSPVDENDLKAIILEGLVPSASKMLEYIRQDG